MNAGIFETPTLAQLRRRCESSEASEGPIRFFVLQGRHKLTDIAFQEQYADGKTLFQLASQFNGLESPGPYIVPVSAYFTDHTQGPIGALQTYPGALLRHYAAPGVKGRFIQSERYSLNFLAQVWSLDMAEVQHGYLLAEHIPDPHAALKELKKHFENFQLGLHRELEAPLSASQQPIAQALCSTLAAPYSKSNTQAPIWNQLMEKLLEAAYTATILAAISHNYERLVLTAIGGGVFGNPHPVIWSALLRSIKNAQSYHKALDIWLNLWDFDVPQSQLEQATKESGGRYISLI